MASDISTDALIWLSVFGPMLLIAGLGFTARHVSDVLSPSLGEEA